MALVMRTAPGVEPVAVADASAHLRLDTAADDLLIASLILTSRLHVEATLDLALIDQAWTLVLDRWPAGADVAIPMAPLKAVTAVTVKRADGTPIVVPPTSYLVDMASKPPRLVWNATARPDPGVVANGIEIEFEAGFGATAAHVPAPLRHAILMLVAHWYEHRDPIEIGSNATRIPDAVSDLIQPFRKIRL